MMHIFTFDRHLAAFHLQRKHIKFNCSFVLRTHISHEQVLNLVLQFYSQRRGKKKSRTNQENKTLAILPSVAPISKQFSHEQVIEPVAMYCNGGVPLLAKTVL